MDGESAPLIIVMAVLVLLSAFFSSAETAYSSLNKVKLKAMAALGKRKKGRWHFQNGMILCFPQF